MSEEEAKEVVPEAIAEPIEGEKPFEAPPPDGAGAKAAPEAKAEAPAAPESAEPPPAEGGETAPADAPAEGAAPPEGGEAAPAGEEGAVPPPAEGGEAVPAPEGGEAAPPTEGTEGGPPAEGGEDVTAEASEGVAAGEGAEGAAPPAEGAKGAAEGAEGGEAGGEGAEGAAAGAEGAEGAEAAPIEDPGPPPPPPYVPPEVGEDYVPVGELPPIPLPYAVNEDGGKIPLAGVESIFLTGTTLELLELNNMGSDKEGGLMMATISKERIIGDIQFRGAISDFHPVKQKILDAEYEELLIRVNEDDTYGNGNNFEIATSKEVGDLWKFIGIEGERRKQLLLDEELREAIERAKPKSKKTRIIKPWISGGSEVEVEEASVVPQREPIQMIFQKGRREFNMPQAMSDKDAHELWNSSQMECRPFKDPNFDLRKSELDVAVQAVAPTSDTAVQATGNKPRPKAVQYSALEMVPEEKKMVLEADDMTAFLRKAAQECEHALIQNEVANIYHDDFSLLSEEDGVGGNRKESIVTEYQSFTHLTYSKNKVVSAIQWLPGRKGVVAVACTEAFTHSERVARAGRPSSAYILIWNFKDPIHPEYVLQAPFEVFSFQFNPTQPDIVAAGLYNGQCSIWDISGEQERIAALKHQSSSSKEGDSDDAAIPIVKAKYNSMIESSHHGLVTDLHWLPGVEITGRGRVSKIDPKECNFFATISGDGKVNFWDIRMEKLMKKGRKAEDPLDMAWKPTHSVHLISLLGMDLSSTRLCFDFKQLDLGNFFVGSFDGELVYADFVRPEGEDNPDYSKSCNQIHVGPIVALQRSPFFDDVILSVGDWCFQIWKEGGHPTTPLFQSGYAGEYYTAGCWSPTRPAVIFLTDTAGNLEIWDLLDRSHEPSIRVTLASTPFMSIAFMAAPAGVPGAPGGGGGGGGNSGHGQQFLALGDSEGSLRILELPRNLRRPVPNEKKMMTVYLEREASRIEDVMARLPARSGKLKEAGEKEKAKLEAEAAAREREAQAKEALANGQPLPKDSAKQKQLEMDERAEAEYYKLEHKFKLQLGLIDVDEEKS